MTPLSPPAMTAEREAELAAAAAVAGASWARSECDLLRVEGRPVEGGWPGTLSQAREQVREAVPRLAATLSHDELSWLARTLYDCARRDWLAACDASAEQPVAIVTARPPRAAHHGRVTRERWLAFVAEGEIYAASSPSVGQPGARFVCVGSGATREQALQDALPYANVRLYENVQREWFPKTERSDDGSGFIGNES